MENKLASRVEGKNTYMGISKQHYVVDFFFFFVVKIYKISYSKYN